jgi:hypothetical protein
LITASLGWNRQLFFSKSEMALFFERMGECAQKVLDTADIVREAILLNRPTMTILILLIRVLTGSSDPDWRAWRQALSRAWRAGRYLFEALHPFRKFHLLTEALEIGMDFCELKIHLLAGVVYQAFA